MRSDAPPFASWFASRLPGEDLDEYYEPTFPPGDDRLRELYAHSAFFTWHLLRLSAVVEAVVAATALGLTLLGMYGLAAGAFESIAPLPVLDLLFSVVLGILALRALGRSASNATSWVGIRRLADELIATPPPTEARVHELTDDYDFEHASALAPPTILYRILRGRLGSEWSRTRAALTQGS